MSVTSNAQTTPASAGPASKKEGSFVTRGVVVTYLSVLVLIPLAAAVWQSTQDGFDGFIRAITNPQALAALRLTFLASLVVVAINIVAGTLIAWVLVRDSFRGKAIVNSLIDLPFALPTIVAGLTLLALYGPRSPVGLNVAYTKASVAMALLFVTLPFVIRAVQPVLLELDRDMEEAAASLGASGFATFRRIILPTLTPAILSGAALGPSSRRPPPGWPSRSSRRPPAGGPPRRTSGASAIPPAGAAAGPAHFE